MNTQNTQPQTMVLSDNAVPGWPQTLVTTNGKVLTVSPNKTILATLHGVGTIHVHPWGRGLYSLLADHARGAALLDEVEFWMECDDQSSRKVVLEFNHRHDWRISPTSDPLDVKQTETIKTIMGAIYAQALEG